MRWASRVVRLLGSSKGVLVPPGRLPEKVSYINSMEHVACAVEIHFNGAPSPNVRGGETLYHHTSAKGRSLATGLHGALMTGAPVLKPDRGVKKGWYRMNPTNGPLYFLRKTKCPAVIVEPGFLEGQISELNNRGIMDRACQAMATFLSDYTITPITHGPGPDQ